MNEFTGRHNVPPLDTMEQMQAVARGMEGKRLRYVDLIAESRILGNLEPIDATPEQLAKAVLFTPPRLRAGRLFYSQWLILGILSTIRCTVMAIKHDHSFFGWLGNVANIIVLISLLYYGVRWVNMKLINNEVIENITSIGNAVWLGISAPIMLLVIAYLILSISITIISRMKGESYERILLKFRITFLLTISMTITSLMIMITHILFP